MPGTRQARSSQPTRVEQDSLGSIKVPIDALWGAQTQRAVENFPVSGQRLPRALIRGLGLAKAASAEALAELCHMDRKLARAIRDAAIRVAEGHHDDQFPVDIYQTGSGTSSNMNANEVIARLAARRLGKKVDPNDDVNRGQSSNDSFPSAAHIACCLNLSQDWIPAMRHLQEAIDQRAKPLRGQVKPGRTHLMDAMPLTFEQELSAWSQQIRYGLERVEAVLPRLRRLAQGATAVGTGINSPKGFSAGFCRHLASLSGEPFRPSRNRFESLSSIDTLCELSAQLKVVACSLMKISNDLRWMNSGPGSGLGEIQLPALQPGSSIMPGKVNPVIPESVCMVAARVIGNDASVSVAAQSGNFQLNVMQPLAACLTLESIHLTSRAAHLLADKAIAGLSVNTEQSASAVARSPVLVTAAVPVLGYALCAEIAKRAQAEDRPLLEVAQEMSDLPEARLRKLFDPLRLARGGVVQA